MFDDLIITHGTRAANIPRLMNEGYVAGRAYQRVTSYDGKGGRQLDPYVYAGVSNVGDSNKPFSIYGEDHSVAMRDWRGNLGAQVQLDPRILKDFDSNIDEVKKWGNHTELVIKTPNGFTPDYIKSIHIPSYRRTPLYYQEAVSELQRRTGIPITNISRTGDYDKGFNYENKSINQIPYSNVEPLQRVIDYIRDTKPVSNRSEFPVNKNRSLINKLYNYEKLEADKYPKEWMPDFPDKEKAYALRDFENKLRKDAPVEYAGNIEDMRKDSVRRLAMQTNELKARLQGISR